MREMKDMMVLSVVAKFIIPFIIVFALYVQFHGDYSPGGGFQAGVILASAFVLYCIIWGLQSTLKIVSLNYLKILAAFGVLIYSSVGVVSMLLGGHFLDYDVLSSNPVSGQHLGILIIEFGVGLAVFSVILLIFLTFVARGEK